MMASMEDLADVQSRTFQGSTEVTRRSYPPENRLDQESLDRYLDRRAFLVVATTRADGRPHTAMSSFVRRGSRFWLPTAAGSVRERHVRHTPWASLVVTEGDRDEHVVVIVEGPAAVVEPDEAPADIAASTQEDWVSLWLRVDAERVLSYAAANVLRRTRSNEPGVGGRGGPGT